MYSDFENSELVKGSLFTPAERAANLMKQAPLVLQAKQGRMGPLLAFWRTKRTVFVARAEDRHYG